MSACTCDGDRWPNGERIVTVGCPIHHVMPDGTPASEVEVVCMCGEFADERHCTSFTNTEEDEEPFAVCGGCLPWARSLAHLVPTTPTEET